MVVGDTPSAYLVTDEAPDPASARRAYCDLMEEWASAVSAGKPLKGIYPVAAAPTKDNAEMLNRRMTYIRDHLIPQIE